MAGDLTRWFAVELAALVRPTAGELVRLAGYLWKVSIVTVVAECCLQARCSCPDAKPSQTYGQHPLA